MATTDNALLLSYVAIFDREMTTPVLDAISPPKDMLVDLFAGYVNPPRRPPVTSASPLLNSSKKLLTDLQMKKKINA